MISIVNLSGGNSSLTLCFARYFLVRINSALRITSSGRGEWQPATQLTGTNDFLCFINSVIIKLLSIANILEGPAGAFERKPTVLNPETTS